MLFQDDFWTAVFPDDHDGAVPFSQDNVVSRSAHLKSCFLKLEKMGQDLESKLRNDFDNILNSMDGLSLSPTPQPPSPPMRITSSSHNSPFTIAAYSWLLENIANPYPSPAVKVSLAQRHNLSLSAVNTWFVNTRRRMGWTALCRDYFNNCRGDALDAAYRALVREDPDRPLPPDVIHAIVSVKAAAEALHSSTHAKSALAGDLDAVVRDVSEEGTTSIGKRRIGGLDETVSSPELSDVELQHKKPEARQLYPSPVSSCSSSPVPALVKSLTDDSDEEEFSPPTMVGRKRRLSCSDPAYDTIPAVALKRRKRLCPDFSSLLDSYLAPSPKEDADTRNQSPHSEQIPVSSCKQLLSDANIDGIPKRPREPTVEPLPHGISDSLSLSTLESDRVIDEWFDSNLDSLFALPPPVDVTELDATAQWEVELFNNYKIPEESQDGPFGPLDPFPCNQTSAVVDLSAFDDFIRSMENGGFVPPLEWTDPVVTVSANDLVARNLSPSADCIDWDALFNLPSSEPSLDSSFTQSNTNSLSLPEIDLSVLQLPN